MMIDREGANAVRSSVLVCGDRNWTDRSAVRSCLHELQGMGYATLIHGACRGADMIAAEEAEKLGYLIIESFHADWSKYGRAAGPVRNQQMLDVGCPDLVVYFHNDITNSKGTRDMISRAARAGIEVRKG